MTPLELELMPEYQEALRLSETIARRESVRTDTPMTEALFVATVTRLQSEGLKPTGRLLYDEMDYTHPREVRDVLAIRLRDPEQYAKLPSADFWAATMPVIEAMSEDEQEAMARFVERGFRGDA